MMKLFTEEDSKELAKRKKKGVVLSFYLGIKPEVDFRSEANSLAAGKIKEIRKNEEYSKNEKKKIIAMIGQAKKEIDLLKLLDNTRTIIIFFDSFLRSKAYRFPAYIVSELAVGSDPCIRPALAALENFPRYLSATVERDRAAFLKIFSGEIEGEPEIISSDVPKRIRTSTSDDWKGRREAKNERHIEDHLGRHFKKVSARLTKFLEKDGFDYFILSIHKDVKERFMNVLDGRIKDKIIGFLPPDALCDIKKLKSKSLEIINSYEKKIERGLVKRLLDGAGGKNQQAVLGIDSVLEHLYLRNIGLLVISRGYKQPGFFCSGCRRISTYLKTCPACESRMTRIKDLADEILKEAVRRNISLRILLNPYGDFDRFGVGALFKTAKQGNI